MNAALTLTEQNSALRRRSKGNSRLWENSEGYVKEVNEVRRSKNSRATKWRIRPFMVINHWVVIGNWQVREADAALIVPAAAKAISTNIWVLNGVCVCVNHNQRPTYRLLIPIYRHRWCRKCCARRNVMYCRRWRCSFLAWYDPLLSLLAEKKSSYFSIACTKKKICKIESSWCDFSYSIACETANSTITSHVLNGMWTRSIKVQSLHLWECDNSV